MYSSKKRSKKFPAGQTVDEGKADGKISHKTGKAKRLLCAHGLYKGDFEIFVVIRKEELDEENMEKLRD